MGTMTSTDKIRCLRAALLAVALASTLASALIVDAGSASAQLNWKPVATDDERIIFKVEDLGPGRFVRTFTQRMTADSTIEVGNWQSATAVARISLQVTGHNVYLYHIDPGEHASKRLRKALDWGPKDSIKNQLGHVSYRLARDGGRSCIAFAVMYSFAEGSGLPSNGLAGYYCTENELRPQRVIECLGETDYGVPACQVSKTASVPLDPIMRKLLARAEQGDAEAQFKLALRYGRLDSRKLWLWMCRAANRGYVDAKAELGLLYSHGKRRHIPQNTGLAYMWLSLAAKDGDRWAAASRDRLAADMTAKQIDDAKRLVSAWKAKECTIADVSAGSKLASPRCKDVGGYEVYMNKTGNVCQVN